MACVERDGLLNLIFTSVVLNWIIVCCAASGQPYTWKADPFHLNLKFTTKIAFQDVGTVMRACADNCSKHVGCSSFAINTQHGSCIGYTDEFMNSQLDSYVVETGWKYFTKNDGYKFDRRPMSYYRIYTMATSDAGAKSYCINEGADQLIVDSRHKYDGMWEILMEVLGNPSTTLYVSGHYDNGVWKFWNNVTIPDESWNGYTAPSMTTGCVGIANGGLKESPCGGSMWFICEKT